MAKYGVVLLSPEDFPYQLAMTVHKQGRQKKETQNRIYPLLSSPEVTLSKHACVLLYLAGICSDKLLTAGIRFA